MDGTDTCAKSFSMAADLAHKFGAEILILTVQSPYEFQDHPDPVVRKEFEAFQYQAISERILEIAKSKFEDTGIPVTTHVIQGNPAHEIIEFADKQSCDMIIMCTHGMGTVKRFMLGSVTNKVVHHASVPVLVVR